MSKPKKPARKGHVTESRVKHIVGLMVSSQWVPHHTKEALAVEWGIAPGTVEHYACEASRRIRSTIAEGPELRAQILANLQTIAALCVKGKRYGDAIKAYQVMSGVDDISSAETGDQAVPRFIVELTSTERPCPPPSGASSPPPADPATS